MKSSFSGSGHCIHVLEHAWPDHIVIRERPALTDMDHTMVTNKTSFAAFIKGVKAGEFDHFVEG